MNETEGRRHIPGSSVTAGSILGERKAMKRFRWYIARAYVMMNQP